MKLDLHEFLSEHFGRPGEPHRSHIMNYQHNSREINMPLIVSHGLIKSPRHRELHQALKSMTKPLLFPLHVNSGVGIRAGNIISKRKIGDRFTFHAFTSTSIHQTIADGFAKGERDQVRHTVRFTLPRDSTHGAYIGHIGGDYDEGEFLLHPGQTWRKAATSKEGTWRVVHHFEPARPPKPQSGDQQEFNFSR